MVPNTVQSPTWPDPAPARDPFRVVVLARLEPQKRVEHAVLAFAQVQAAVPQARLDIYGSGSKQAEVQQLVDTHGLTDHVTLHGYDRNARDALWTASVFLLTSRYEGYPLSTLESLSRGCPVVSYDVPYGPREQISEGVDGFVVPEADIDGAAARVIELLRDPELVTRMGAAGRRKALQHDEEHFLADWAGVLNRVLDRSARRVEIGTPDLQLDLQGAADGSPILELRGRLTVAPEPSTADAADARISLVAIDRKRSGFVEVPLTVQRRDLDFDLAATINIKKLMRSTPDLRSAQLQLRLDWENDHWNAVVSSSQHGRRAGRETRRKRRADPAPRSGGTDHPGPARATGTARPDPDPEGRWSTAADRRRSLARRSGQVGLGLSEIQEAHLGGQLLLLGEALGKLRRHRLLFAFSGFGLGAEVESLGEVSLVGDPDQTAEDVGAQTGILLGEQFSQLPLPAGIGRLAQHHLDKPGLRRAPAPDHDDAVIVTEGRLCAEALFGLGPPFAPARDGRCCAGPPPPTRTRRR